MQIIGNRVLVSRVEEEQKEGFQTVEVQDSFVYKGVVEQVGGEAFGATSTPYMQSVHVGDKILFAKYSPDTHEVEDEGVKKKIVLISDILAIL